MNEELRDLVVENMDTVLEHIIDEDYIKDIPLIGNLVKLWKIKTSISDKLFFSKMARFLRRHKSIDQKQAREWKQWMLDNPEKATKIAQNVILCLDAQSDLEKCEVIGHLFRKLIENKIPREIFDRLIFAVSQAYIEDLIDISRNDERKLQYYVGTETSVRLQPIGFFYATEEPASFLDGKETKTITHVSPLGKIYKDSMSDFIWSKRWK